MKNELPFESTHWTNIRAPRMWSSRFSFSFYLSFSFVSIEWSAMKKRYAYQTGVLLRMFIKCVAMVVIVVGEGSGTSWGKNQAERNLRFTYLNVEEWMWCIESSSDDQPRIESTGEKSRAIYTRLGLSAWTTFILSLSLSALSFADGFLAWPWCFFDISHSKRRLPTFNRGLMQAEYQGLRTQLNL